MNRSTSGCFSRVVVTDTLQHPLPCQAEPFDVEPGPICSSRWAGSGQDRELSPPGADPDPGRRSRSRSEEHTSELQSRENIVCRLLLEKKKTTHNTNFNIDIRHHSK